MNPFFESQLVRLQEGFTALPDKPEENPENTLKALWLLAQDKPVSVECAAAVPLDALSPEQQKVVVQLVDRRLSGVPLPHLTSRQQFMNIEMLVSPGALIPRKETEILANAIVTLAGERLDTLKDQATIIDSCTGVGNVAVFCAHRFPSARIHASDLSSEAVAAAVENSRFCGADRIDFRIGDLLHPFELSEFQNGVDLLTCNPPYISQGKLSSMPGEIAGHEPRAAFDGGPFGISIISRLINEAHQYLKRGAWLIFEIGLGQGNPLLKRIERIPHYEEHRPFTDSRGEIRALGLCKK